jgi:hypothetical protein
VAVVGRPNIGDALQYLDPAAFDLFREVGGSTPSVGTCPTRRHIELTYSVPIPMRHRKIGFDQPDLCLESDDARFLL